MKSLFLISILIVSCSFVTAQPPAPGSNIINNNINKFEGTWQWVNGTDTVVIKLKKINTSFETYTEDVLMGVHKYVLNGVTIENSLNRFDSITLSYKKRTLLLYQNQGEDTSKIIGSLKDLTKKKLNNLILEYVAGTPPTIIWHLDTAEGTFIDPNFQYGLTMPKEIILTKQ